MDAALLFLIFIVIIAWLYDFYNGANDAANAIATTVSTRILTPVQALLLATVLNTAGAFVTTRVAKTIGKGIVEPSLLAGGVLVAALIGAILWVALSTRWGIPVSVTHALVGGIVGAVAPLYGLGVIQIAGMKKILAGMVFSPVLGFIGGVLLLAFLFRVSLKARPKRAQWFYGRAQLLSASFMALSHGTNDTQNAMGIITVALFTGGFISEFEVPFWVILGSGIFMGIGTYAGGKKVIKTVGMRIAKLKPLHGFSAETAASGVIMGTSWLGIPISTTHAITSSVLGVGTGERLNGVRWDVMRQIVFAWIFTIPGSALCAAILSLLFSFWL